MLPEEQLNRTVSCAPAANCECGGLIRLSKKFERRQIFEIPQAAYEVIEYQIHKGRCRCCSRTFRGEMPKEAGNGGFGARTHAMVSLLSSRYRMSKRQIKD